MTERRDLPAGGFSPWLRRIRVGLVEEDGADVPCGECSACCTTSHFVHVRPEETQTLARIPQELLFPAPALPAGNVLLGYDEQGRCPMLTDGWCSIYEHRPLTCRTYDCRVFAAAGITADSDLITGQARRWKFRHPTQDDRDQHAAVRPAARFVRSESSASLVAQGHATRYKWPFLRSRPTTCSSSPATSPARPGTHRRISTSPGR